MRRTFIPIAEVKDQLNRINGALAEPILLIGGLAVQQYHIARTSVDIDLVCDHDTATHIIRHLYPSNEWTSQNLSGDEYRPVITITKKKDPRFPAIKLGPKFLERDPYEYIDWDLLKEEARPFEVKGEALTNILIPTVERLCFTKLISFLCRSSDKEEKVHQDLRDVCDLSNNDSFRLAVFYNTISSSGADSFISREFQQRVTPYAAEFSQSYIYCLGSVFMPSVEGIKQNGAGEVEDLRVQIAAFEKTIEQKLDDVTAALDRGFRAVESLSQKASSLTVKCKEEIVAVFTAKIDKFPGTTPIWERSIDSSILISDIEALIDQGKLAEAEAETRRLLESKPDDIRVVETYIGVLLKQDDKEKTELAWEILKDKGPNRPQIYKNVAHKLWEAGEMSKAIDASKKALSIAESVGGADKSEIIRIKANLAYYCADSGKAEHRGIAIEYATEAYKSAPENPSRVDTLGYVKVVYGSKEEILEGMNLCVTAYQQALKADAQAARIIGRFLEKHIAKGSGRIAELAAIEVAAAESAAPG